jgi:hypothetical protein
MPDWDGGASGGGEAEGLQQLEVVVVDLSQLEAGGLRTVASGERPGIAIPTEGCAFLVGEPTFTLGLGSGAHVHSFGSWTGA